MVELHYARTQVTGKASYVSGKTREDKSFHKIRVQYDKRTWEMTEAREIYSLACKPEDVCL